MQKQILALMVGVLSATALTGCTTTGTGTNGSTPTAGGNDKTVWGAVLGASAGALGGYFSSGNDDDRRKNAMIAAGIGALAGGAVGNYMDKQEASLRQDLAGTGVDVTRVGDNILLNMPSSVTFGFNQAFVLPQFHATLGQLASTLNQYPSTMIDIVGHTDSVGSDNYNQDLSLRRAQNVATYLIGKGVLGGRLFVRGMGESAPIASNATEDGRAQNRRVEVLISPVREGF
ncbi:MAG: hypothetical protein COY40_00995 [Alphaproteobacteria bacterium CG_4_10_14_0_8_um_filter_53_9]|nr:MAG: hypothetical protein COY40_00995 [Alphaproteobacteria bacterium CG_4_10_14_0_8_um_filter_53_9]